MGDQPSPLAGFSELPEDAPVLIVARFRCRPGDEAETERRLRAHVAPTHEEHGCDFYALHRVAGDPSSWVLVERWSSKDAFRAHHRMPHLADLPELVAGLEEPPTVVFLDALDDGDPAKGRLPG